jgi:hypothetical protein
VSGNTGSSSVAESRPCIFEVADSVAVETPEATTTTSTHLSPAGHVATISVSALHALKKAKISKGLHHIDHQIACAFYRMQCGKCSTTRRLSVLNPEVFDLLDPCCTRHSHQIQCGLWKGWDALCIVSSESRYHDMICNLRGAFPLSHQPLAVWVNNRSSCAASRRNEVPKAALDENACMLIMHYAAL